MNITGRHLIEWGFNPGPLFPVMLAYANQQTYIDERSLEGIKNLLLAQDEFIPVPKLELKPLSLDPLANVTFNILTTAGCEYDLDNLLAVEKIMGKLMRTPVATRATVLPDACPTGPNSMPVGTVVESPHIHPGWHSADICCSMFLTEYKNVTPAILLDAVSDAVHFGPGGPDRYRMTDELLEAFMGNSFLNDPHMLDLANRHLGSSGDGNHFASVGTMQSSGNTTLVTHSGSRGPGARLYKIGMKAAQKYTKSISPATHKSNAWIDSESAEGIEYWKALQIMRDWTKLNHTLIHASSSYRAMAKANNIRTVNRFWNEHNFVFKRNGMFLHGKGATPAFDGWADDAKMFTIIPLNAAEPILITRGSDNPDALGFAPHGAGRLISRAQHKRDLVAVGISDAQAFEEETRDIDMRFWSGEADVTELPSAYKNASMIREGIKKYELAQIVDQVLPYGCIMGGVFDWRNYANEQFS